MTYFTAMLNLVTYAFLLEKVKTVDFSETNAASDLKVGRFRQLIEFMKVCEYLRSMSFLAHLSRRLTGELIGYPWIRRQSVRRPSVYIFKHLLL